MLSAQEIIVAIEIGIIYGILGIGIYLTFRVINFPDLTCEGSFVIGAAVSSYFIKYYDLSPVICLFLSMFFGGVAGLITALLNLKIKIDDLLSGIITAFMLYSINLRILGTTPTISLVNNNTIFTDISSFPFTICGFIMLALLITLTLVLSSDFGLGLKAIGKNRQFSSANGINVNFMLFFSLILSNALIGLCGAVFSQYQGFCDISQGMGSLVIGLASVIIGEKLRPEIFSKAIFISDIGLRNLFKNFSVLIFCVMGSVIYRIFIAVAINSDIFGLKTQDLNLITGILMIFIMRKQKC
ncbi:MAG: hypothetical protein IJ730_00955 [Alphaproteobacteria bacterium]|nr:hypothetical protein [Alphaproteobacteria bacterium]